MLSNLFRAFRSQPQQQTAFVAREAQRIDDEQLKLVAGGLPKGGWLEPESMATAQSPRDGWN